MRPTSRTAKVDADDKKPDDEQTDPSVINLSRDGVRVVAAGASTAPRVGGVR